MFSINEITHPDPEVQQKVSYFFAQFNWCIAKNRNKADYELESHLSIIEKLRARANWRYENSTMQVVSNLLEKSPLFNTKSDYLSRKLIIKQAVNKLKTNINIQKKISLELVEDLETKLNTAVSKTYKSYFESLIELFISHLYPSVKYEDSKEKLKYVAMLLASEYVRVGFSIKELRKQKSPIGRIFNKEVKIGENGISFEFPIPQHIEDLRGTDEFVDSVQKFIKDRSLPEQFMGLFYIYSKKMNADFILRIADVSLSDEFEWHYGNVVFISANSLLLRYKTSNSDNYKRLLSFLLGKSWMGYTQIDLNTIEENKLRHTLLAISNQDFFSIDRGAAKAVYEIEMAKNAFHFKEENRYGRLIPYEYVVAYNNERLSFKWERPELHSFVEPREHNENSKLISTLDDEVRSEIAAFLQRTDLTLFRAFGTSFWDEEIIAFWRYVELLAASSNSSQIDTKKVIQLVSSVLSRLQAKSLKSKIINTLHNLFVNCTLEINCTLTNREAIDALHSSEEEPHIDFFRNNADHEMVTFLCDEYLKADQLNDDEYQAYFEKCLWELNEQRNTLIHNGQYCQLTIDSLREKIPGYLKLLREDLIQFTNQHPEIESSNELMKRYFRI